MTDLHARPARILPAIVAAQFAGVAIWFAGNAVLGDLQRQWSLPDTALGYVTSAVQLGFIAGTLTFAFLAIADRYSPRLVYLICSLLGALANLAAIAAEGSLAALLAMRFITGFFLAGIYPVGMKIASGWYQKDLGNALGLLVGALVLGTAFPHLLKGLGQSWPWETVLLGVSVLCALGGMLMYRLVPDGPFLRQGANFDPAALASVVRSALTIANCVGFAITIFSIQLLNAAATWMPVQYLFLLLAPGPVFGLLALRPLLRQA